MAISSEVSEASLCLAGSSVCDILLAPEWQSERTATNIHRWCFSQLALSELALWINLSLYVSLALPLCVQVPREPSVSNWPRQGAKRTAIGTVWMTSRWLWIGFGPWAVSIKTKFRIQAGSSLRCAWAWQKARLPYKTLYVWLVGVFILCFCG